MTLLEELCSKETIDELFSHKSTMMPVTVSQMDQKRIDNNLKKKREEEGGLGQERWNDG